MPDDSQTTDAQINADIRQALTGLLAVAHEALAITGPEDHDGAANLVAAAVHTQDFDPAWLVLLLGAAVVGLADEQAVHALTRANFEDYTEAHARPAEITGAATADATGTPGHPEPSTAITDATDDEPCDCFCCDQARIDWEHDPQLGEPYTGPTRATIKRTEETEKP
jgi:hypothetical protein